MPVIEPRHGWTCQVDKNRAHGQAQARLWTIKRFRNIPPWAARWHKLFDKARIDCDDGSMLSANVHFSSKSNEWETPIAMFDQLDAELHFTLDPCCTDQNRKCPRHFTAEVDGLTQSWAMERVFMNPPYGREIGQWIEKAYNESLLGATVVCLVPSRTDTNWWHDFAAKGQIRFIRGRLKFNGHKNSAPFPSAVVIFKSKL